MRVYSYIQERFKAYEDDKNQGKSNWNQGISKRGEPSDHKHLLYRLLKF